MRMFHRAGDAAGTSSTRPRGRLVAAGTGLLATALLAGTVVPAHAQGPMGPAGKARTSVKHILIDQAPPLVTPYDICKRYPKVCELQYEEPVLTSPVPDPGPFQLDDLVLPAAQLNVDLALRDLGPVTMQLDAAGSGG